MVLSFLAPRSEFEAPSLLYSFVCSPLLLFARTLYQCFAFLKPLPRPSSTAHAIRVVCISDTHSQTRPIPSADLLIHAGDLAKTGSVAELQEQIDWLDRILPTAQKVVIAGNHDTYLDPRSRRTLKEEDRAGTLNWGRLHYLQHREVTLHFPQHGGRRLKIYGAPQIPACGGPDFAFQYDRNQDAWTRTVPSDIDILVTHAPPKWHLDLPIGQGCQWLLGESWRVKPRLHVFGHIHAARGLEVVSWDGCQAAYERICTRHQGPLRDMLKLRNWIDLSLIWAFGVKGLVWRVLWGGRETSGVIVNSALMVDATKNLDNEPRVVYI